MTPEVVSDPACFAETMEGARKNGRAVGLVPTMGALHAGHRSLIAAAAADCDTVAVTIFVNPLQFGAGEDLARYPRRLEADLSAAASAGATHVFAPTPQAMYPQPFLTTVHVGGLSADLEGAHRPGHFDGVSTVVTKLFALAGRCRAYFGEKDYQQLLVVRRLAAELGLPAEVVSCPTVREADGLACSSRNANLDEPARAAAPVLYRALRAGAQLIESGERDPKLVTGRVADVVDAEPLARLDYAEVVEAHTLERAVVLDGDVRLLVAARVGAVRLIDNLGLTISR